MCELFPESLAKRKEKQLNYPYWYWNLSFRSNQRTINGYALFKGYDSFYINTMPRHVLILTTSIAPIMH